MFISSLALMAALWYINVYGDIGFSAIVFTLTVDNGAVEEGILLGFVIKALLPSIAITAILMTVLNLSPKKDIVIKDLKHKKEYKIFPFSRRISSLVSILLIVSFILSAALLVSFPQYIVSMLDKSRLYEDEYIDPKNVAITFPEQKRNLIYIMLESMETSFFSKDLGGGLDYNVIPELYNMAADPENTNFSHSLDIGGWPVVTNATWTIASIVSQTSGIPLSIPAKRNTYGKTAAFLPGVTSITNILKDNGYYQAVMFGSDGNYAGRDQYYLQHGANVVYDWYSAMDDGIIPQGYKKWWGMEDMKLYEYAKQVLPEIAQKDQPFCFSMLTVDTHHVGGYKCELCGDQHEEKYENVYSCASKQVASFVEWIKTQPFYENTTIIIVGDHASMDAAYFDRAFSADYQRHMYNCFINCPVKTTNVTERSFTPMDMFPTTLASIGCTIPGERLGLGTNLFSDKQTLAEKYTIEELNTLLGKKSDYYMDHFVK
jgi:phosphoglycerol transferase